MSQVTIAAQNGLLLQSSVVTGSGGTVTGVAAITGQIIRVYKLFLVIGSAVNITFEDGSSALSGALPMSANGSIALDNDGQPWFTTSAGNAFNILQSGSAQISGTVYYTASQN